MFVTLGFLLYTCDLHGHSFIGLEMIFCVLLGRARHPEGILLTFLNERLQKQEQKNDYRETLMYTALEEIQGQIMFVAFLNLNTEYYCNELVALFFFSFSYHK